MTLKSVSSEQQKISHLLKFNSRSIFLDKLITFLKSEEVGYDIGLLLEYNLVRLS
jgi:hypothetical protein